MKLSYKGNTIPLPNFFRENHYVLNKFSILENLPAYTRAKANPVLNELNEIKHFAPEGRPVYSANITRWVLLLRHTSAFRCHRSNFLSNPSSFAATSSVKGLRPTRRRNNRDQGLLSSKDFGLLAFRFLSNMSGRLRFSRLHPPPRTTKKSRGGSIECIYQCR